MCWFPLKSTSLLKIMVDPILAEHLKNPSGWHRNSVKGKNLYIDQFCWCAQILVLHFHSHNTCIQNTDNNTVCLAVVQMQYCSSSRFGCAITIGEQSINLAWFQFEFDFISIESRVWFEVAKSRRTGWGWFKMAKLQVAIRFDFQTNIFFRQGEDCCCCCCCCSLSAAAVTAAGRCWCNKTAAPTFPSIHISPSLCWAAAEK